MPMLDNRLRRWPSIKTTFPVRTRFCLLDQKIISLILIGLYCRAKGSICLLDKYLRRAEYIIISVYSAALEMQKAVTVHFESYCILLL